MTYTRLTSFIAGALAIGTVSAGATAMTMPDWAG